jgi:flavin reductase (DIM6/NTAB) family NADH-FMN oxidoreductase RutF
MSHDAVQSINDSLRTPLLVVTTEADGTRAGCVVGFYTQCSIEPPQFAVWISKANFTYRTALFAKHLALHFLTEGDDDIAELFGGYSGDDIDKFERCEWHAWEHGLPLLDRLPNRIVLERLAVMDAGGDHVCFVGAPVDASSSGEFEPLRITEVDIDPGHRAQERGTPEDMSRGPDIPDDTPRTDPDETKLREDLAAGAGHPVDLPPEGPG